MVCGATTFREFVDMLREERPEALDGWVSRMWSAPATVVSSTLDGLQDRPDVAVE